MTKHIILTALAALVLLASCSDGPDDSKPTPSVGKSGDISVTANDAVWTYYSLEPTATGNSAPTGMLPCVATLSAPTVARRAWVTAACRLCRKAIASSRMHRKTDMSLTTSNNSYGVTSDVRRP